MTPRRNKHDEYLPQCNKMRENPGAVNMTIMVAFGLNVKKPQKITLL